ncbi:hypothetical protein PORY_000498 [Pneumocystis oryctolagi]|uniref:Uncharacterized protein n=1 Tax=Pneumocystis oryctolagi TaxID=42067 RepID=A0ACB7CGD2_9ASCO|nr:hypothetical protein PORY_000498 [Pneumocystis oryctolagi]
MVGEQSQKQMKNAKGCQTVSQRMIPASEIIFHQAKKQFAALRLENKSSSKSATNVQVSIKPMNITQNQGFLPFQNKIPMLKISPSLNTVITPKCTNGTVIRAKVPTRIVTAQGKASSVDSLKKTNANGTLIKTSQTSRLTGVRVKTTTTQSPYQQKQSVSQSTSPNKRLVRTVNTPVTLRIKPGVSPVSSSTISSSCSIHQKSETKPETPQSSEKKKTGAIKVISVNSLSSRQPKTVTENGLNKPLRLAPSLSKNNISRKTCQYSSSDGKPLPLKPFASVTNLMSHEKFGKPTSFVTSSINHGNN